MKWGYKERRVYLDWASAAPVRKEARRAFENSLDVFGNPSSAHEEGRLAKDVLEESRTGIARLAGVKSHSVLFTSGATESNALAIQGRVRALEAKGMALADMHVLYLSTMHASVRKTVSLLETLGVRTEPIARTGAGIDLQTFSAQLTAQTVLICVDAVCGETGIRYDTRAVRTAIDTSGYSRHALLHVDASQLPLVEPISQTRLGASSVTLDAQKVGGVRGIGALVVTNIRSIARIMEGGGQEQGLRPGTEAIASAAAFAAALQCAHQEHAAFSQKANDLRTKLVRELRAQLPTMTINEGKYGAPHILNLSFIGIDTDYTVMLLDSKGFAVATKSACETDSETGSNVIYALTGSREQANATLRISWGPETSDKDLMRYARALVSTIHFQQQ